MRSLRQKGHRSTTGRPAAGGREASGPHGRPPGSLITAGSYSQGGKRSAKPEAHCNTKEEIWTGVRIFLAPFRGVSKWYRAQYAAVFEWVYNTKRITGEFVRALLGLRVVTNPGR